MCKDFPFMQYELAAINQTIQQLSSLEKLENTLFRVEDFLSRAMYGITFRKGKFSEITPYPTISLFQHSFSPFFNFNLNLCDIAYKAITNPLMNFRETGISPISSMLLNFYGNPQPKDTNGIIRNLKTMNNIQFSEWYPNGFVCYLIKQNEIAFYNSKKEVLSKSLHCFQNCKDSELLYSKLNKIDKKDWNIKFIEYDDVKNNLEAKIQDYKEIYNPFGENEDEN